MFFYWKWKTRGKLKVFIEIKDFFVEHTHTHVLFKIKVFAESGNFLRTKNV